MNDRDERPRDDAGADQPDGHEPAFDDPTHAWIRDLLADARVTTPPPADVVARLDDTLAALGAERARTGLPAGESQEEPATVVPLRRRLRPRLAAAAAAVILVAAGGVALTRLDLGSSPTSDSAASGAADSATVTTTSPSVPGSAKGLATGAAPEALADSALPPLTTASFAADAAAVMRRVAADQAQVAGSAGSASSKTPVPAQTPGEDPLDPPVTAATSNAKAVQAPPVTATPESLRTEDRALGSVACVGPDVAGAVTLPATLDGTPVALVFRPPTAAGQRVEAWSCDGSTVLAAATVAP